MSEASNIRERSEQISMNILSIETSCDETSLAIIEANGGLSSPKFKIKKLLTASQIETHRPFGGVVPNLAKREHQKNLPLLFKKLVGKRSPTSKTRMSDFPDIDLLAVTTGPGLEPCLWQGIEFAKKIQKEHFPKAKIIPTNHLHGHMYSFLLPQKNSRFYFLDSRFFPTIQLLVSGGHTILLLMESLTKYKKLGETRDDAAGEAFDKVARMLGLPYPGGPEIEGLAKKYRSPTSIEFPRPMIHDKNYDFSFSGLKTAVLYYLQSQTNADYTQKNADKLPRKSASSPRKSAAAVAAAFQEAVIDVLTAKTLRAAKEYNAKSVILSGGVAANQALRKSFQLSTKNLQLNFLSADKKFQGDNAAMIAVAGYIAYLKKRKYPLKAVGTLDV